MTADGADRGTLEYYNMIRSKAGRKWLLKDAPVRLFAEMTGPLPKNFDKKKLLANTAYYILPLLQNLQQYSIRENLRAAYEGGNITPELLEILDTPPVEYTPDEQEGKEKYNIIATLIHEKKIDFEPFRGKRDIEPNWPFFYRLDFSPLPDFRYRLKDLHYISDTLDNVIRPQIRTYVLIALEGKETFVSAEDDGRKEKQATPLTAADFMGFAELIESQYNARIAENTPLDWPAPFKATNAGFYINPKTYVIKDLRPYTKEINTLLSLSSWDYLKDFADAIREAVADWKQEQKEKKLRAREGQELREITVKKTDKLIHAIDKVDENLFAGMFDEKASNQPALFHTVTIDKGKQKGKKINVTAYIDYEKLPKEITKELTDYDRRVYESAAAIFNAGNEVTTLTQIYSTMGGTGRPAKHQLEKINQSITKMMGTLFHVDNQDEIANNINYPKIEYDGALLPMERITATINGKITDAAIHLFREPPLMTFARERKQIFTCSLELLQSPLNISETKFAIEHCLLSLLAMGKHDLEKEKKKPEQYRKPVKKEMLLETIYQRAKTTDRRTKPRTKEKIITLLTHYKSKGQIKNYKLTNDRVILEF